MESILKRVMSKYIYLALTYILLIFLVFDKYYPGSLRRDVPSEEGSTVVVDESVQLLNSADVANEDASTLGPVPDPLAEFRSEYNINGTDRFQWYREQMFSKLNINETKTAGNISTLYAYEFEHEIVITTTSFRRVGHKMFCRYLDENNKEIGEPYESFTYPEYIVYCQKREGVKKIGLSVEENGEFDPLPIVDRMPKKPKYELSMCVATIYGDEPKWLQFIEMVEHFKLQGVQHFYLHVHNASVYDMKVINEYVRTGEVEVHFLYERDYRVDRQWHYVNLADCLIWSRGDSKWTIFADLDERLYMTNYTGTLLDYVREVKNDTIGSLVFRQQWILKTELLPEKYEGDKQLDEWMPTHRWHNSTGIGAVGHTTKCIVNTEKVFIMFIHYVTQYFPKPNGNYINRNLEPEEGLIRHYRDQSLGSWGTKWLHTVLKFGDLRNTNYPEAFLGKLTENVKRRARYVYENIYFD